MISIIDYGMGNLRSVQNALDYLGHRSRLIHDAGEIIDSKKLILPGVGSFREAMGNLARLGIIDAIREAGGMGTPILGICLGMQLFAEQGEEGGSCEGLGLIRGRVVRLNAGDANLKVPHMGFNQVTYTKQSPLFAGIKDGSHFYFAHSYHFICTEEDIAGVTIHGHPFTSVVVRGNVMGTQFHPEKSQSHGLRLLQNFCKG